ncbi:hypothetical protein D3C87_191750 [compost metagenome]
MERILSEFPFLQSARAIYLKGLYNQDSFRYNTELKKTAAYTTDRSVLFDFITSEQFQGVEKKSFEAKEKYLEIIPVNDSEIVESLIFTEETIGQPEEITIIEQSPIAEPTVTPIIDKLEESIKSSLKAAGQFEEIPEIKEESVEDTEINAEIEIAEEKLDMGKPLEFDRQETHSFAEWLKLSKLTPINREEELKQPEPDEAISKKMELIDKFIETNPKIAPVKNTPAPSVNVEKYSQDNSSLMTETLARVYLEQKKYSKAIQAYEILILKYPEKSVFFADRILDIKILQQNNN